MAAARQGASRRTGGSRNPARRGAGRGAGSGGVPSGAGAAQLPASTPAVPGAAAATAAAALGDAAAVEAAEGEAAESAAGAAPSAASPAGASRCSHHGRLIVPKQQIPALRHLLMLHAIARQHAAPLCCLQVQAQQIHSAAAAAAPQLRLKALIWPAAPPGSQWLLLSATGSMKLLLNLGACGGTQATRTAIARQFATVLGRCGATTGQLPR